MQSLKLTAYTPFENQSFLDEMKISIDGYSFKGVAFIDGKCAYSISNCNFESLVISNIMDVVFEDISICFTDCYIKEINIDNIISKNVSVSFHGCILSGRIRNNELKIVTFNNCILVETFFLINIQSVQISFTEENINPKRWIKVFHNVSINKFKDAYERITAKQSYYIDDVKRIFIYTHRNKKKKRIELEMLNINLSIVYGINIEDIETKINDVPLTSLSLNGNPNGKITIENSMIHSLYMSNFSPQSEFSFYNIAPLSETIGNSRIEIHQCNLDKAWFDNVNFIEYSVISFFRSKFSNTTFTSCSFPENYQNYETVPNIHYIDEKTKSFTKDRYETFLQLKKSLESTGNFYEAQKFQAFSNDALKKIEDIKKGDKFILRTNKLSNNHGLSILWPFLWFLGFSILFYILYLLSLHRIFNQYDVDYNLFGYYFSFIDITHRSDFLADKSDLIGWSLFIDSINKILMGYFIYQFIAAFRKYGKK